MDIDEICEKYRLNFLDKKILEMIDFHEKTGESFITCDDYKSLMLGWISSESDYEIMFRLVELRTRKIPKILSLFNIKSDVFLSGIGRRMMCNILTDKNHEHYSPKSIQDIINLLNMNEALS